MELFTTFDGRISRKSFWLGILGLFVAAIVLAVLATVIFGSGPGVNFVLSLILLYPSAALIIKRLHDHNKPATPWAWIFLAPNLISSFMQVTGIGFTKVQFQGTTVAVPGTLGWIITVISVGIGIWALVELGFLRGTQGDNDYGPDPVAE